MKDRNGLTLGRRVRIADGSGPDSNRIATVIHHSRVRVRGDGIADLPGEYKKINWRTDALVQFDDGAMRVYPKSRLMRLGVKSCR